MLTCLLFTKYLALVGDIGMNDEGQCGVGHDLPLSDPTEIDFPDGLRVVSISCGHSHTGKMLH